jgi:hypothetical protein
VSSPSLLCHCHATECICSKTFSVSELSAAQRRSRATGQDP